MLCAPVIEPPRTAGISICHVSPEAAVDDATLAERHAAQEAKGWKSAENRNRRLSTALKAYAVMTTSAAKGAVRRT
ncbi:MAG: hypothetical protein J0H18_17420 [Rhizobiales bacterium]|nr:hypothetical protein [Hyphomicrobiales bacterium]